jgi:hypothetical protein
MCRIIWPREEDFPKKRPKGIFPTGAYDALYRVKKKESANDEV